MSERIGYVRVSTVEQNESRQIRKMHDLGIDDRFLFIDKSSGKDFDRPKYQAMLHSIRKGDVVHVDALDRLGRNYDAIIEQWKYITRVLEADIVILDNKELFDSRKFGEMGDMGKLMEDQFLSLLAFVAEQERKKIRQRQREGIEAAKARGKHMGRPRIGLDTLSREQRDTLISTYAAWKTKNITAVDFMKRVGLKKNTFYKVIKEYENHEAQ